jgi:hypothetical protein
MVYLLVYVDDLLMIYSGCGHCEDPVARDFRYLGLQTGRVLLGPPHRAQQKTLWLRRERYANELVERFGMQAARAKTLLMSAHLRLIRAAKGGEKSEQPHA